MKQIILSIIAVGFLLTGAIASADGLGTVLGVQAMCDADGKTLPDSQGAFLLSINFMTEGGRGYLIPFSTNVPSEYDLYQSGNNIMLTDRAKQFSLVLGMISMLPAKCEADQKSVEVQFKQNPNILVESVRTGAFVTTSFSRSHGKVSENFSFIVELKPE